MMTIPRFILLIVFGALLLGCGRRQPDATQISARSRTPAPTFDETIRAWPNAPYEYMSNNEPLKRAWLNFERTEKYRLAQPSDRNLTPPAAATREIKCCTSNYSGYQLVGR
jgi:hypothetical protein